MRRLLLASTLLLPIQAFGQSVPNPETPIVQGIVWTPQQWINAWQSKVDVTNGSSTGETLTNPTINNPTITGGTINGATLTGLSLDLTSPPPIGTATPNTGAFATLAVGATAPGTSQLSINATGHITFPTTGNGGIGTTGNSYIGDTAHFWFQGANWGFGRVAPTTSNAVDLAPVLTVQRNGTYTGSTGGNPSALSVINTIGANVTGGESGIAVLMNDSGTGGIHVGLQLTINKLTTGTSTQFGANIVATDKTGRKSSVAGSLVGTEFDVIAAGPDDGNDRINLDLIGREFPGGSTDGATTITVAGARVRGQTVQGGAAGVINTPSTSLYGFRAQTVADTGSIGQIMAFQTPFAADAASSAAFQASSAVQTQVTNASAASGATTLTLATTNDKNTGYVWPGALVTGTNIAPNTHVLTQSYDANVTITITLDTPTSGAIANGATLTFTNKIQNGFVASGYIPGNAFQAPNWHVDGSGNVTLLSPATFTMGAATATGFGTAIGQVPLWQNFQSSGHPGLTLSDRLIFQRGTPTAGDFADLQLNRSTAFTSSSSGALNAAFRVTTTVGANDGTQEYGIISQTVNNGTTAGGLGYALFAISQKSIGATANTTGGNIGARDFNTSGPSSTTGGGIVGLELGTGGSKADDATNAQAFGGRGIRVASHISCIANSSDTTQAECGHGLWFAMNDTANTGSGVNGNWDSILDFALNTQIRVAVDTRAAIAPTGSTDPVWAVDMKAGHGIEFNGSASLVANPGANYLAYDAATSKLKYYVAGVAKWSIDASGNIRAAGTITPSVTP